MNVNSYTFQSPYPQPFQIGRPDPANSKEDQKSETLSDVQQQNVPQEPRLSPTKETQRQENKVAVPLGALVDGNTQSGVAAFKSLNSSVQGQKAYVQEAVS